MEYRWVDTPAALEKVIAGAAAEPVIAVDTEFHRERTYAPVLGLLQIAGDGWISLIDPLAVDVQPLIEVFQTTPIVLHAGDQDLSIFSSQFGVQPANVFDTQIAAGFLGMTSPSLAVLTEKRLGVRLEKGDQLSDWTRRPLAPTVCNYAAGDVAYLLELQRSLVEELSALGRLEWAREESREATIRAVTEADPTTAWWKLKGARRFRVPAAGIAQEVGVWREARARIKNRNPRSILPDLAYAAIVARKPSNIAELQQVRGLEGRQRLNSDDATTLFEAIRRGELLSVEQIHFPPDPSGVRVSGAVITILTAVANQLAVDANLDPSLVATRADVTSFAAGNPSRLDHGWRAALVAAPLRALIEGASGVGIRDERLVVMNLLAPPASITPELQEQ